MYCWSDLSSSSHGPSGSCLWSCLPLWSGSGMDSPCQPPQTLNIAKSSRKGSSSSGPSARHWPITLTEGLSRARSSTYSKESGLIRALCNCKKRMLSIWSHPCHAASGCLFTKHLSFSPLFSFVSSEGVSYMTVCHCSLPVAKAFCFLEDLRWEFTACFNSNVVALAERPYPFLEFGEWEEKYFVTQICWLFSFFSHFCFLWKYDVWNGRQSSWVLML